MKKVIIGVVIIFVAIGCGLVIYNLPKEDKKKEEPEVVITGEKVDYVSAGTIDYDDKEYDNHILDSYVDYKTFADKYEMEYDLKEEDFKNNKYLVVVIENDYCNGNVEGFRDLKINDNKVTITVDMRTSCGVCAPVNEVYLLKVDKNFVENFTVDLKYNSVNEVHCDPNVVYKPVIYFYPEYDMSVSVKLGNPNELLTTYPKYNNGWNVYVKKDGTLVDSNNRKYYALYWEGKNSSYSLTNDGFVVKGEDTISFLEKYLSKLGLNYKESNEFIMYWLPKLESNKYNYIRFILNDELDEYMSLDITPKPKTTIRILMAYKPLTDKIDVKPQTIVTPKRDGFTVVEWGGTLIK